MRSTMDPFQTLPAPILEMILELIDDLPSLHNLHDASPAVASLLHEDGVAPVIVEAIISRNVPWHARHLIRRIALIRWNNNDKAPPVPSSWDAFVGAYMWKEDYNSCCHERDRDPLTKSIPPSIICRILSLASRVRLLAHRCIHEMIDRCMTLEPSRLQDPGLQYRGDSGGFYPPGTIPEYRPARIPPGERFQPVDVGPPSWVEEQRVCRAIWRLIMFFELRDAVVGTKTRKARWCWPEKDVHRLRTLQYDDFWKPSVSACVHQMHELKTVAECLFSLTSTAATASTERYPSFLSTTTTTTTTPTEKSSRICSRCPPTFESKPAGERTWGQSKYDLNWSGSPGFHFVVLNLGGIPQSPLRYVELRVFRRFGFAIWDWRRMEALGFLKAPSRTREEEESHPNAPVSKSDAYFRWRSILTEAELEEVKRRRKHYWLSYDTIVPIPDLFG